MRWSAAWVRVCLPALLAITACSFEPKFTEGTISCHTDTDCPPSYVCAQSLCYALGSTRDGAVLDTRGLGGAGGGAADGPADLSGASDRPAEGGLDTRAVDGGSDARTDTQPGDGGDGGCRDMCTLGDKRCGTLGLQTCVMVGQCPTWGPDTACPGRQTCQGTAPGARCTCPPPPTGCEGGKGNVCVGAAPGTARVCDVDGESCVFETTSTVCTAGKPCAGAFPGGACTCPAPPAICAARPGTYCESPTSIATCGFNSDGCLAVTRTTTCAVAKPCAVVAGSATCSCTGAPTECGGSTGGACRANGDLATCDLDQNGCLAVTGAGPCPSGLTCQGAAPASSCKCPAPPAVCNGTTGTFCQGTGTVVNCGYDTNGCLIIRTMSLCPGVQTCGGSAGTAKCSCPAAPAKCPGGAGNLCDTGGVLLTCVADGNGCLSVGSSAACPSGQVCAGAFPTASCGCPAPPAACMGATSGNVCQSATSFVTCGVNAQGCVVITGTAGTCPGGTKPCAGSPGSAACVCTTTAPAECLLNGTFTAGNACKTGLLSRCMLDGNQCPSSATMTCPTPQACQGTLPNALCACPAGYNPPECDMAGEIDGSRCSGTTLLSCSNAGAGCQRLTSAACVGTQACVGAYPAARCADETPYGWPIASGRGVTSWFDTLVAQKITLPVAGTLRRFGLVWAGNGSGSPLIDTVTMALYPDGTDLNGSGPLGKILAETIDATVNQLGPAEFKLSIPTAGERLLPAGDYWMVVNIRAVAVGTGGYVAELPDPIKWPIRYVPLPYGTPFPDPIASTTSLQSGSVPLGPINFYLVVMPQQ